MAKVAKPTWAFSARGPEQGKPAACRPILIGPQQAAGEDRADVLVEAEGNSIGGSDGEGAHRSMATTAMAVGHWGAPVRARRSGLSQSWSGCRSTPRRGGARGGRDGLGDAWMAGCR
jgi:hypothetical protein